MRVEVSSQHKPLVTDFALEWFLPTMRLPVFSHGRLLGKVLATHLTLVGLFSCVRSNVASKKNVTI